MKSVVEAKPSPINSDNEGKLVHVIGSAETQDELSDTLFGVDKSSALKLQRSVDMYQWVEHKKSNTDDKSKTKTTYTYDKEWSSNLVDSDHFYKSIGHQNPKGMPYSGMTLVADPIQLGSFVLSTAVTNKMNWYEYVTGLKTDTIPDNDIRNKAKSIDNGYFMGSNVQNPQVGDTRARFRVVVEQVMSIVALQSGDTFATYSGQSGGAFLLVEQGRHTAKEMFMHANQALTSMTWAMRFAGSFCIWIMLRCWTMPFEVFAENVPLLGMLVGAGSRLVAGAVALVLSCVVIAFSWFWYRPLISILMFLIMGASGAAAYKYRHKLKLFQEEQGFSLVATASEET